MTQRIWITVTSPRLPDRLNANRSYSTPASTQRAPRNFDHLTVNFRDDTRQRRIRNRLAANQCRISVHTRWQDPQRAGEGNKYSMTTRILDSYNTTLILWEKRPHNSRGHEPVKMHIRRHNAFQVARSKRTQKSRDVPTLVDTLRNNARNRLHRQIKKNLTPGIYRPPCEKGSRNFP